MRNMKKLLPFLLVFSMVLSYVPMPALAAEECPHSGGSATCKEPAVCELCLEPYGVTADHSYVNGVCECGAAEPHSHVFDGEATYEKKDDSVHTVTRACTGCEEKPTQTVDQGHTYVEGVCACGQEEPHQNSYVDGVCGCGTACAHEAYASGVCVECGAEEPHSHFGGSATCTDAAVCEGCGESYGEAAGHSYAELVCTVCGTEASCICDTGCQDVMSTNWACPVCTEDFGLCAHYVPSCLCAEKCTEETANEFCPICAADYTQCGGEDTGVPLLTLNTEGYYEISSAAELSAFAKLVNESNNTSANAILTTDIECTDNWTPIGTSDLPYTGTFDGQNYTISGLNYNDNTATYVGLFGYVGSGGIVKNVGVVKANITGNKYVGGVVGSNSGTVKDCYSKGDVSGNQYIGGVVGYNGSPNNVAGIVTDCYHEEGTVSGTYSIGGVVGYNDDSTVKNCHNKGIVSGSYHIGGVVGSNNRTTVEKCYNTGSVTGSGSNVGGVVGFNDNGTVTNCYYQSDTADTAEDTEAKTTEQFASGEVAYLLGDGWGQNIDNDEIAQLTPVLSGAAVYKVENCKGDTVYSNTTNIVHKWENGTCTVCHTACDHTDGEITYTTNSQDSTKHNKTYSCCGRVVTEDHSPKADSYTIDDDSKHSFTCTSGCKVTESHTGMDDNICDICGYKKYSLWVGDTQVTSVNKDDVLGETDTGATVTYNPETNTLTLNNAAITWSYTLGMPLSPAASIYCDGDLNIALTGNNTVSNNGQANNHTFCGIYIGEKLTITGSGSLSITSETNSISDSANEAYGISAGNLTIGNGSDSPALTATGSTGGVLVTTLTMKRGELTATGRKYGIYTLNNLALTDDHGGQIIATGGEYGIFAKGSEYSMASLYVGKSNAHVIAKATKENGTAVNLVTQRESSTIYYRTASNGSFTERIADLPGSMISSDGNYFESFGSNHMNAVSTGSTITADCACGALSGTLTISAPAQQTYGDEDIVGAGIAITDSMLFGANCYTVTYQKQTGTDQWGDINSSIPTDAGTYKASVKAYGSTASVIYEIAQKELTITGVSATGRTYERGNKTVAITEVAIGNAVDSDDIGVTATMGTLSGDQAGTYKEMTLKDAQLTGKDAGNYRLPASLTATTNVTISRKSLADFTAEYGQLKLAYNENVDKNVPTVKVTDGDYVLVEGTDYFIKYFDGESDRVSNPKAVGTYRLQIEGMGNYDDAIYGSRFYITMAPIVTEMIEALPKAKDVEPDDKAAIDAYEKAKTAYDALTDKEKEWISKEHREKLEKVGKDLTAYDIVKGHKSNYVLGSNKTLSFTANGYFGKFTGVEVDGKLIDEKYYTAKSGSTIITLKSNYLQSLKSGKHTIQVNYTDGDTGGEEYFRVSANNGSPMTGDNSNILFFSGMTIVTLLCMVTMLVFISRKKSKYQR